MRGFNDFNEKKMKVNIEYLTFPSPCGVLMILIEDLKIIALILSFPSPCGVLMILIVVASSEFHEYQSFRPHAGF